MSKKHYILSCLFAQNWNDDTDSFNSGFIDLIYLREGIEGITDSINHIANMIKEEQYENEDDLFNVCYDAFKRYTDR